MINCTKKNLIQEWRSSKINSEIITNLKGELQELKKVFDNMHAKMNTNLTELFEKNISEFVDNKLSENTM